MALPPREQDEDRRHRRADCRHQLTIRNDHAQPTAIAAWEQPRGRPTIGYDSPRLASLPRMEDGSRPLSRLKTPAAHRWKPGTRIDRWTAREHENEKENHREHGRGEALAPRAKKKTTEDTAADDGAGVHDPIAVDSATRPARFATRCGARPLRRLPAAACPPPSPLLRRAGSGRCAPFALPPVVPLQHDLPSRPAHDSPACPAVQITAHGHGLADPGRVPGPVRSIAFVRRAGSGTRVAIRHASTRCLPQLVGSTRVSPVPAPGSR